MNNNTPCTKTHMLKSKNMLCPYCELDRLRAELSEERNAFVIERTEHKKALEELAIERRALKQAVDELTSGIFDENRPMYVSEMPNYFRNKAREK